MCTVCVCVCVCVCIQKQLAGGNVCVCVCVCVELSNINVELSKIQQISYLTPSLPESISVLLPARPFFLGP